MTSTDRRSGRVAKPKRGRARKGLVIGIIGGILVVGIGLIVAGFVGARSGAVARHVTRAPAAAKPAVPSSIVTRTVAATSSAEPTSSAGATVATSSSALASVGNTTTAAMKATIARLDAYDFSGLLGRVIKRGTASTGMVALTFDDGPGQYTEQVLSDLRQANIHATFFFVAGRARGHVQDLRDALAGGNEFGDHTFSHVAIAGMGPASFDAEVGRAQRLFRTFVGFEPKLLRPQGGHQDARSVALAKKAGLVVVDWSIHSTDTNKNATVASITRVASAAPAGAIVLMHETKRQTVEAIPGIIAKLKARGLKLVTVSQLLAASYGAR